MAGNEKKTVKLRIQVPSNVEVVTEIVGSSAPLALSNPGIKSKNLVLDLTSKRTAEWLNRAEADVVGQEDHDIDPSRFGGGACCVRG